jgi:mannose-6-phosphate isomerase-like protein (cupin superfamily)
MTDRRMTDQRPDTSRRHFVEGVLAAVTPERKTMNSSSVSVAPCPSPPRRTRALSLRRLAIASGLLFAGMIAGVTAARAVTPAPAYSIQNAVKAFSMEAIEKTKVGYQYWFFDQEFAQGRTVKMSVVGPHLATHPPHEHEGHEFFFVLEGQAEFFLEGKTRLAGPQTALYAAPHLMHGIRNVGDGELKYLVIRDYPWPAPPSSPGAAPKPAEQPAPRSSGK